MAASTNGDYDDLLRMPCCTVPLRLLTPEHLKKKGNSTFYCPKCGLKYFGEIAAIDEWLKSQREPKPKTRKKKG
jgi:hypothetical protein